MKTMVKISALILLGSLVSGCSSFQLTTPQDCTALPWNTPDLGTGNPCGGSAGD